MENPKLQEWAMENKPEEKMIYKQGYWDQIVFIRDTLRSVLSRTEGDYKILGDNITVISTHTSKSILLPVFKVVLPNGVEMIMRYNFHDWKISVSSPFEIDCDFLNIFNYGAEVHSVYCEGFEEEWVYGPYIENNKKFTLELWAGYYKLYTFLWILREGVTGLEEPKVEENVTKEKFEPKTVIHDCLEYSNGEGTKCSICGEFA